jgi:hypothetical protein
MITVVSVTVAMNDELCPFESITVIVDVPDDAPAVTVNVVELVPLPGVTVANAVLELVTVNEPV